MRNSNTMLVGLAGTCAICFLEILKQKLLITFDNFDWNSILLILSTFSVYIIGFKIANYLDCHFLWRFYLPVLNGKWQLQLTNLEDSSSRVGEVNIIQTRDSIMISAINYKLPNKDEPYSTWKSIDAIVRINELFFTYEVESSVDSKPFKRGYMKFSNITKQTKELLGNYYDAAPSNCQGPIILRKI